MSCGWKINHSWKIFALRIQRWRRLVWVTNEFVRLLMTRFTLLFCCLNWFKYPLVLTCSVGEICLEWTHISYRNLLMIQKLTKVTKSQSKQLMTQKHVLCNILIMIHIGFVSSNRNTWKWTYFMFIFILIRVYTLLRYKNNDDDDASW